MSMAFNLLDEPWLPVRMIDGEVRMLGMQELFARSGEIGALAETAPPSLIAQYRVLLAITHRALVRAFGRWKDADRLRWYREGLPLEAIHDYLEHWRERFWLFHPEYPFMQVAALAQAPETRDKLKPWTQISLASANGNTPVLFDHSCDLVPGSIAPAEAVRTLLGFLQFTPGGLVKTLRDADKAGPLANTAAVLPLGETLAQTLCLALHPPTGEGHDDVPCWEGTPPGVAMLRADPRLATGPDDRYTRLSRAVLFVRDERGWVAGVRFAAGIALADDPQAPDFMASYRAGTNGLVRLTFTEGRAFWRDLPALLPDAEGLASQPAAVLRFAANLRLMSGDSEQAVLVAGLASDQAKLLRWRAERFSLPTALLASPDYAAELRRLVRQAEELFDGIRKVAAGMFADTLPDPGSKDTWSRARALFDGGPATALYYSAAERSLGQLMVLLGEGDPDAAEMLWRRTLLDAALAVWEALIEMLGRSPAALRAEAKAYPRFRARLAALQPAMEHSLPPAAKEA